MTVRQYQPSGVEATNVLAPPPTRAGAVAASYPAEDIFTVKPVTWLISGWAAERESRDERFECADMVECLSIEDR
ncbi:hypothetical protein EPH_0073400 [Eimeria praecox]|uniref:Uncharacterized protein n=1 Tax=Eimeria praecox TaxID=51316 RepID=U6H5G2_9EIME|nr:hypothetical protein EPH_0073400 [Eimeria praecox]